MDSLYSGEFDCSWTVNGYLSSGKTLTLKELRPQLSSWMKTTQNDVSAVKTYELKQDQWCIHESNLLTKMTECLTTDKPSPWAVRMQVAAIGEFIKRDLDIQRESNNHLCFQERDVNCLLQVFLPFLRSRGILSPEDYTMLWELAMSIRDISAERMKPKKEIFLYADKDLCYDRFCQKNVAAEKSMSRHDFNEICLALDFWRNSADYQLDTSYMRPAEVAGRISDILKNEYSPLGTGLRLRDSEIREDYWDP